MNLVTRKTKGQINNGSKTLREMVTLRKLIERENKKEEERRLLACDAVWPL
jgi:cell division protein YceG involved in septum cleavage